MEKEEHVESDSCVRTYATYIELEQRPIYLNLSVFILIQSLRSKH